MGCSHALNKRQKETQSESLEKFIRSLSRLASVVKGARASRLAYIVKGPTSRLESTVKGALIKLVYSLGTSESTLE